MKQILNEPGHSELSNNIKYKAIGLVLTKIRIFEFNHEFLSLGLTRLDYAKYNSPYTT